MEANEISKGASAVWGNGGRDPPEEVERNFDTTRHVADHNMPVPQRQYSHEETNASVPSQKGLATALPSPSSNFERKAGQAQPLAGSSTGSRLVMMTS